MCDVCNVLYCSWGPAGLIGVCHTSPLGENFGSDAESTGGCVCVCVCVFVHMSACMYSSAVNTCTLSIQNIRNTGSLHEID